MATIMGIFAAVAIWTVSIPLLWAFVNFAGNSVAKSIGSICNDLLAMMGVK